MWWTGFHLPWCKAHRTEEEFFHSKYTQDGTKGTTSSLTWKVPTLPTISILNLKTNQGFFKIVLIIFRSFQHIVIYAFTNLQIMENISIFIQLLLTLPWFNLVNS